MGSLEELQKIEEVLREKFHKMRETDDTLKDLNLAVLDLVMDLSALTRLLKDKRLIHNEEIVRYRIKIFQAALKKEEGFEG